WTAGDGLDRSHQILTRIQKIPTRLDHLLARYAASVIHALKAAIQDVLDDAAPDKIAAAFDYRVRSHLERFFRKYCWVNAAHDHRRAALLRFAHDSVSGPAISRVDSDADDVPGSNLLRIERSNRLVNYDRVADQIAWRGARKYVQPSRRNHAIADGGVRRIDEKHFGHSTNL